MFSSSTPRSHDEALVQFRQYYERDIAEAGNIPFVYPIASIGAGVGLLFFLIPPNSQSHNRFTRYLTFTFIACWHAYIIAYCRGMNPSTSFGAGIISMFGTMWAAVLLVFSDAKADFKRIRRRPKLDVDGTKSDFEYFWQPYPTGSVLDRLRWTLDIWTNFRLTGWEQKLKTMPSYPAHVQRQLNASVKKDFEAVDQPVTRTGVRRFDDLRLLIQHNAQILLKGYFIMDFVSTLTRHDAYFRGIPDAAPPVGLPAFMYEHPAFWIKGYRLIAGMFFIWLALRNIMHLHCLIPIMFKERWTRTWSEPWLYPDHYGKYSLVLDKGLSGWWGGWWHQSFRVTFLAGSDWLIDRLGIRSKSGAAKAVTLIVSFFMSGALHAAGSATQSGPTQPFRGPMLFFMLQPFGIGAEMLWHLLLANSAIKSHIPTWLAYAVNFIWVHAWFWLTAPILIEDMAKGGLWLYQPVPFSFARLLGLGTEGDSFFCWGGEWARWHHGESWWSSGIAM